MVGSMLPGIDCDTDMNPRIESYGDYYGSDDVSSIDKL